MKCCDMTAGMLRQKITIERATRSGDGVGGVTETWAEDPAGGVWAHVKAMSGGERLQAMRISPRNRMRAVIRFRDDGNGAPYYSAKDRVKVNGRTYDIEAAIDMEFRRQWIQLELVEGEAT